VRLIATFHSFAWRPDEAIALLNEIGAAGGPWAFEARRLGRAVLPGEGILVPIGAAALYGGGRAQWIRPPVSSRRHPPSARSSSGPRRTPNICSVPRFCEQYFGRPHQAGDLTERGNLGRPIGDHATAARPVAVRWVMRNWRMRDDRAGWRPAWTMTP
jgi:hypothetical protein